MYLKSIEMYGFKSFANKIVFDFHNGITGIVGPNGSGKSNVSDAVRWVLGEQSAKQLRGASMQDVIFAGTENRKPLSYAYVAITMDNSDHLLPIDYEEVTIARRVYRSGESEYLLNGSPCRLKDVNELFYDTGIGKEGYSIIGQGQIERILSGKPEERRELFDEAVGIVKFKKRKAATVKKLEHERENLVRVNDILSELERQVGPLERQAENAKLFLKKKEELKTLEVNMFLLEIQDMNRRLSEIEKNYQIAETQMTENKDKQEKIKDQYASLEEGLNAMDEQIQGIREEQSNTTLMKGKLENQIRILEEQIRFAESADENLSERKGALEAEKKEYIRQKDAYETEKAQLQEQLEDLKDKCEILFVDGGSTDRTLELIRQEYTVIQGFKGRAVQMNEGAKRSTGDILLFLHCDSELPERPLAEIRRVMKDHAAGCFGIAFHSRNFFMWTCKVISNHRIKDRKVMFGDQGIFVDRDLFFEAGMFPELPIMEDYQFSLNLKEMGVKLGMAKRRIYTSDRRFPKGTISKLKVMWKMNRLRKMHRDGVDIHLISQMYKDIR